MGNEVDFMVHGYVPLNIFGHEVWLTTTHVCLLIVCLFMLVIGLIVNNKMKHATEVPGMVQNIAELYVEMMDGVVQSSMFRHWGKYANYILTIFMFLLFSNISGLFGLRPPTADYGVTLPLALITFVLIQFNAFKWKGVGGYVKDLMDPIPLFLPIILSANLQRRFHCRCVCLVMSWLEPLCWHCITACCLCWQQ